AGSTHAWPLSSKPARAGPARTASGTAPAVNASRRVSRLGNNRITMLPEVQYLVQNPAPAIMRPRMPEMSQDLRLIASDLFECIGENHQPVKVRIAIDELCKLLDR